MVKPATRLPKPQQLTVSDALAEGPAPTARSVTPAPTNGVPFTRQSSSASAIKRRGRQLGARIPDELYERVVSCAAATRIPQGRLLERALDTELKTHGF